MGSFNVARMAGCRTAEKVCMLDAPHLHARTGCLPAYLQEPDEKRHLLRLWMAPPAPYAPPLPQCYAEIMQVCMGRMGHVTQRLARTLPKEP